MFSVVLRQGLSYILFLCIYLHFTVHTDLILCFFFDFSTIFLKCIIYFYVLFIFNVLFIFHGLLLIRYYLLMLIMMVFFCVDCINCKCFYLFNTAYVHLYIYSKLYLPLIWFNSWCLLIKNHFCVLFETI